MAKARAQNGDHITGIHVKTGQVHMDNITRTHIHITGCTPETLRPGHLCLRTLSMAQPHPHCQDDQDMARGINQQFVQRCSGLVLVCHTRTQTFPSSPPRKTQHAVSQIGDQRQGWQGQAQRNRNKQVYIVARTSGRACACACVVAWPTSLFAAFLSLVAVQFEQERSSKRLPAHHSNF